MLSSELRKHPSYMSGRENARLYVVGETLAARMAGLAGLDVPPDVRDFAIRTIGIEDWGPRVAGLQMVATHHAQSGEGATGAAVAIVVCELFEAASKHAPADIKAIARRAITSVAIDLSCGVLRTPFSLDAVAWADATAPRLRGWGEDDAALVLETLASEALFAAEKFGLASSRLPDICPSNMAGRPRHDRLKRLLGGLRPDAPPSSPIDVYHRALAELEKVQMMAAGLPQLGRLGVRLADVVAQERTKGAPTDAGEAELRCTALFLILEEARETALSGA